MFDSFEGDFFINHCQVDRSGDDRGRGFSFVGSSRSLRWVFKFFLSRRVLTLEQRYDLQSIKLIGGGAVKW